MPTDESAFPSITGRFACEVQWGDCDPAGIIFYPTYFRWFDAASWAFFASVGYTARRMRDEGRALPLVAAESQFIHPAQQADRCEVRSTVVRSDGTVMAKGTETRVWSRHVDGPGSPMKGETIGDDLKALFRAH
jgi:YbgC/YbaW family acyl-CoA thioester hydrolase